MIRGQVRVLILVSSILAIGCNRGSGIDYTQPFDPNIIELSNLTYKGVPFRGQVSSLERLGRPDTTWMQQEIFRYPVGSDSLATEERVILGTTEENRDGTLRPLYVSFEAGKLVSLLLI